MGRRRLAVFTQCGAWPLTNPFSQLLHSFPLSLFTGERGGVRGIFKMAALAPAKGIRPIGTPRHEGSGAVHQPSLRPGAWSQVRVIPQYVALVRYWAVYRVTNRVGAAPGTLRPARR